MSPPFLCLLRKCPPHCPPVSLPDKQGRLQAGLCLWGRVFTHLQAPSDFPVLVRFQPHLLSIPVLSRVLFTASSPTVEHTLLPAHCLSWTWGPLSFPQCSVGVPTHTQKWLPSCGLQRGRGCVLVPGPRARVCSPTPHPWSCSSSLAPPSSVLFRPCLGPWTPTDPTRGPRRFLARCLLLVSPSFLSGFAFLSRASTSPRGAAHLHGLSGCACVCALSNRGRCQAPVPKAQPAGAQAPRPGDGLSAPCVVARVAWGGRGTRV